MSTAATTTLTAANVKTATIAAFLLSTRACSSAQLLPTIFVLLAAWGADHEVVQSVVVEVAGVCERGAEVRERIAGAVENDDLLAAGA